mmetsp:Transcript_12521/g.27477  ORF Transcript_12521/g.27477 Transcript_12521/m.27477 type:complete len:400 (-) Transcript_12521:136-1335(-)
MRRLWIVSLLLLARTTRCDNDYASLFFDIALTRFNEQNVSLGGFEDFKLAQVHLLRVPKASSSALSAVARRVAGCWPAGPCCRFPGDPRGTCPSKELFQCEEQKRVIGCTHHHPNLASLLDSRVKTLVMLRQPEARALSAFNYPGIHHNSDCTNKAPKGERGAAAREECLQKYMRDPRWSNVAAKMLSGFYAYAPLPLPRPAIHEHYPNRNAYGSITATPPTSASASASIPKAPLPAWLLGRAMENLNSVFFLGVAEMWELSILVLQTKLPALPPSLDEFSASSPRPINSTSVSTSGASSRRTQSEPPAPPAPPAGSRVNTDPDYAALRLRVKGSERLQQELRAQSWADLPLYEEAIRRLCGELHSLGLWAYPEVRKYWAERRPLEVAQCTEDGIGINI